MAASSLPPKLMLPDSLIAFIPVIYFVGLLASCGPATDPSERLPLLAEQFKERFPGEESVTLPVLTVPERLKRVTLIKEGALNAKVTNAVLLAGIASTETGLAHCWSEAQWACKGPVSPDCGGGPVIAGAGDGACSLQQGGLCMFQFDSGTFADTLRTYGNGILEVAGCTEEVVPFLVRRAIQSVPGIDDERQAVAWMNSIDIAEDSPSLEEWVKFVSWRYNGCKDCETVERKYKERTLEIHAEFGAGFWETTDGKESGDGCASGILATQGVSGKQTLKLRAGTAIESDDGNVLARVPAGSIMEHLETASGEMVKAPANGGKAGKDLSDQWHRVRFWSPIQEEHEGWVSAAFTACVEEDEP